MEIVILSAIGFCLVAWWIWKFLSRSSYQFELNYPSLKEIVNAQKGKAVESESAHQRYDPLKEKETREKRIEEVFDSTSEKGDDNVGRSDQGGHHAEDASGGVSQSTSSDGRKTEEMGISPEEQVNRVESTNGVESQQEGIRDDPIEVGDQCRKGNVQQQPAESTDSDDSFQIVNRPTEFELMNESSRDQTSRIVTPIDIQSSKTSSIFTRVTDTLRRRSSMESPKAVASSSSASIQESEQRKTKDNMEQTGEAFTLEQSTESEAMDGQVEMKKSENAEDDKVVIEEEKDDDRTDGSSDEEDALDGSKKEEDAGGKDESDTENEKEVTSKKRKEWVRNRILTATRAARKAERRKLKRRAKKPHKEDDEFPGGDGASDDEDIEEKIEEEDEWAEESDDDEYELDLVADLELSETLKSEGNEAFKSEDYDSAIKLYTKALLKCPTEDADQLISVLLCNRGACHLALRKYEDVLSDCTDSIEFDEKYVKAYLRRFRANEALEKWHDALADINKAIELDPSLKSPYYGVQKKVEKLSQEQFEKEKAELVDKLKTFGNWALGKVGLSLENFKLEQNSETGAYNIQFVQNSGQPSQPSSSSSSSPPQQHQSI